jgi:hypothetical protein
VGRKTKPTFLYGMVGCSEIEFGNEKKKHNDRGCILNGNQIGENVEMIVSKEILF